MSDDLMTGFVRLKSLLMEAQEEFGTEIGQRLVAAAMRFSKEHGGTTAQAYYGIRDEARRTPGDRPRMSDASDFDAVRDGIGVDTGTSSGDEETVAAAHAALDRLESQNQALQERIETAARYVGKMNHTLSREGWHTSQHCARCDLEPLLSRTQETDPE